MESKRHQQINFFLVVFLEGSGSLAMVCGGHARTTLSPADPSGGPIFKDYTIKHYKHKRDINRI